MSKTIMVSDEVYDKLKQKKEASRSSFTELFEKMTEEEDWKKRKEKLLSLIGTWKTDPEEDTRVKKMLKEGWKEWNKRYASTPM